MKAPTIRDVARLAGVSITTVSEALSGNRPVHSDTAARVHAAVEQLGYRPNRVAASMVTRATRTLGLMVPDIANPFFASLVCEVEHAAIVRCYTTVACSSRSNEDLEERYLDLLLDNQVDALIYDGDHERLRPRLERLAERGTVVVLMDRIDGLTSGPFVCVSSDHTAGGELAARHLLDLGHRRMGVVAGPLRLETIIARLSGFRSALESEGIDLGPDLIYHARDFTLEEGVSVVEQLLNAQPDVTAIFCENDLIALGAMRVAHERGINVPEDISIVGYDDIFVSRLVTPGLTTIRQPVDQLGDAAVSAIVRILEKSDPPPTSVTLPVELVVRESSALVRRSATKRRGSRQLGPIVRDDSTHEAGKAASTSTT
jgi:DNA-binding LacI/PurR family transcriptional regulator